MKKLIVLLFTIALVSVLVSCGVKTEATAEFKNIEYDQSSISFDIEISDEHAEITGTTIIYLHNENGKVRDQRTIGKEEDLIGLRFTGLEAETKFTIKVTATIGRDAVNIGIYDFKTLTNQVITVNTVEEFMDMKNNKGGKFILGQDIDFMNEPYRSIFDASNVAFSGTFDGNGYALKNITFQNISTYTGVFGYVSSGVIKNTTFDNINIGTLDKPLSTTTSSRVGIVTGYATNQTARIENITIKNSNISFSTSSTIRAYVGAVAGEFKGVVKDVEIIDTNINITSTSIGTIKIGGAVALLGNTSNISEINSNLNIDFKLSGTNIRDDDVSIMIGGIIGDQVTDSKVSKIINKGDITSSIDYNTLADTKKGTYRFYVGGLIAAAKDNMMHGYFSGSITVSHEKNEYENKVKKQFRIGGLIGLYESNKTSNQIARYGDKTITLTIADDVILAASQLFGYSPHAFSSDKGVHGIENLTINGISQVPEVGIEKIDDLETYFTDPWMLERLISYGT